MTQLTLDMPVSVFAALHKDPKELTREMRIAAAVKGARLELFFRQGVYSGNSSWPAP